MDRKKFLRSLTAASTFSLLGMPSLFSTASAAGNEGSFTLNYAPHFGMFEAHAGKNLMNQLHFIANNGFNALEDNTMRDRSVSTQHRIAETMKQLGMQMGVFVAHSIGWNEPNLTSNDDSLHKQFLDEIRESVTIARRINATWMTVVPGRLHPTLEMGYQTTNVVETLKRAARILEPNGLVMVLEPLNPLRDHPGQFLTETSQAYEICKAVDSDACKILYDVYHQQITEGNLIPNIDYAWDEIAYIQVGDNPGRNEPTTGEINYRNVFRHLSEKGYNGIIGMEHGNSGNGEKGENAVIEAYRYCDPAGIKTQG